MNKLIIIFLAISTISCKNESLKDYITIQGDLGASSDSILYVMSSNFNKQIKVNVDGTFKDTLRIKEPKTYILGTNPSPTNITFIFLKNGFDLNLTLEANGKNFANNLKVSGIGSENNDLTITQLNLPSITGNVMDYFILEKPEFNAKVSFFKEKTDSILKSYPNIDAIYYNQVKKKNKQTIDFLKKNYEKKHEEAKKRKASLAYLSKGSPSPKFVNYKNFKGGKTSLDDLKGKFAYIDIWATWCGPCIREIPNLKKLEKEYHGKNIEFVSISIDSDRRSGGTWEKAENKWKKFVADKNLTGIQLWAEKDFNFINRYKINSIPRFILIDPNGNIVNYDAPRPSEKTDLKKLFAQLGI